MAASPILLAPEARKDLLDIWVYISGQSSQSIADAFLARIIGAMDVVATAPYIGRERPDFSGNPRSIVVRPYVIFYKPFAEGDGIHVWRVLHGARNIPRILRPPA